MSLLAATQIPKPADEQAFERASVVLWCKLLNDPSVQRNGRRGQRQNGVDLSGIRDKDADWHVGIQCKLKSEGLALAPDDHVIMVRAAMVAIEARDDTFAGELLPKLETTIDSVMLKFRYYAARADWPEVIALFEKNASQIPPTGLSFSSS